MSSSRRDGGTILISVAVFVLFAIANLFADPVAGETGADALVDTSDSPSAICVDVDC